MTALNVPVDNLERFDVITKSHFQPRRDLVNGSAPAGSIWHTGQNDLAGLPAAPFFIANDYGPKYLNSERMGYHAIHPIQTPKQTQGNFTISKISLSRLLPNETVSLNRFSDTMGIEILEGQLSVTLGMETIRLLQGDALFVLANTSWSYWSEIGFTSFNFREKPSLRVHLVAARD